MDRLSVVSKKYRIEEKRFYPMGADKPVSSDFQLITGTTLIKTLPSNTKRGYFERTCSRVSIYGLTNFPSLKERIEDLEPNIDFELERYTSRTGGFVRFNNDACKRYLDFGHSAQALWTANFRDLNASIIRMSTLAENGRINSKIVEDEIKRLQQKWQSANQHPQGNALLDPIPVIAPYIGEKAAAKIDYYDQVSLACVLQNCKTSSSMADAGRKLFNYSRTQKQTVNDSHRVKQILDKYGIGFTDL